MSVGEHLISCPFCESPLVQIDWRGSFGSDGTLIERRCPECEHRDALMLDATVADVLCDHHAELALFLEELAERLHCAEELWLSIP